MKINDTGRVQPINPYQRAVETQKGEQSKKSSRKDEVSFSAEAMELLKAQNGAKVDTERAARIESLKQQVAAGTYQVDTAKLVDKLVPFFKTSSEN